MNYSLKIDFNHYNIDKKTENIHHHLLEFISYFILILGNK